MGVKIREEGISEGGLPGFCDLHEIFSFVCGKLVHFLSIDCCVVEKWVIFIVGPCPIFFVGYKRGSGDYSVFIYRCSENKGCSLENLTAGGEPLGLP